MKCVLLTGFEPFDGANVNPSWEAVRLLDGESVRGHRVRALRLPCVFDRCIAEVTAAIARLEPAAAIATGLNPEAKEIRVERVAINLDDARIADNEGVRPADRTIVNGAPAAYFSTLPVKAIVAELSAACIPASVSNSAGTYVCNNLFFGLMHYVAARRPDVRAGFVHVPSGPEPADLAAALRLAAQVTLDASIVE